MKAILIMSCDTISHIILRLYPLRSAINSTTTTSSHLSPLLPSYPPFPLSSLPLFLPLSSSSHSLPSTFPLTVPSSLSPCHFPPIYSLSLLPSLPLSSIFPPPFKSLFSATVATEICYSDNSIMRKLHCRETDVEQLDCRYHMLLENRFAEISTALNV